MLDVSQGLSPESYKKCDVTHKHINKHTSETNKSALKKVSDSYLGILFQKLSCVPQNPHDNKDTKFQIHKKSRIRVKFKSFESQSIREYN